MLSPYFDPSHYDNWANLRLIEFARDLASEQRRWTAPGTYGAIDQTLAHIVGTEQYYVFRLTGEAPAVELQPREIVDLDDLAARVQWCEERLAALFARGFDPTAKTYVNPGDSRQPTMGGMLTQLIYHGCEHRAQIGTILGVHGIERPDIGGWTYSASESKPAPKS